MSQTLVNRDLTLLHPAMRERVRQLMDDIQAENLPLKVFEAWRSPERQSSLYAQGRTSPGQKVTFARAWESYHQYGLAVDIVGFVNGGWTWDLPEPVWAKMHELGAAHGLERLGFETPHLQLADLKIGDLMKGRWPDGGDTSWRDAMETAIARWNGDPPAPPMAGSEPERPAIVAQAGGRALDWAGTPTVGSSDWHSHFNGQEWRHDGDGIYLHAAPSRPVRSPGAPVTCQAILDRFGHEIRKASMAYGVPPEIIVMTIATETAFARKTGFTGPTTFRWEAKVEVKDVQPTTFGDYSAGPMQTLATTAREVIRTLKLAYPDPFTAAPYFAKHPDPAPAEHPLYAAGPNIDIGTAEIKTRWGHTGTDPILVAAAYNAGGLYQTGDNPWHLRSYGDHLDRAAQWFGDACFVLSALR